MTQNLKNMDIQIELGGRRYRSNLSDGLDISIPLKPAGPRAWYVDALRITPVKSVQFNGSVADGGDVNFNQIEFNPHGHGTHTESIGHITKEVISINTVLTKFFFEASLITVRPDIYTGTEQPFRKTGDLIITLNCLQQAASQWTEALVIRTLPNGVEKKTRNYSNTNPPYFDPEAIAFLRKHGVKHLLTDLPSVDRESDGGKLLAHRAFWQGGNPDDEFCTISEMVYIDNEIRDGHYLLNMQIAPFENDASPSKPVLYPLTAID
jgi:kynurenine formamidase